MADKVQKNHVLAVISSFSGSFQLTDITSQVGEMPERTLRRWLAAWCDEGLLERSGKGRATHYTYLSSSQQASTQFQFLQPFDTDIQQALLSQIRDLWSHHSTALEGNTLTLGDTHFILNEGLTISGKAIKDHQEVIGHSRAIDLIYQSLSEPLSVERLFDLHRAVQTEVVNDIYKPHGHWKLEPNGTYAIDSQGQQQFIQYALPAYVPVLMDELITVLNSINTGDVTMDNAHQYYAKFHMGFVHIHPFWDGNGRMARLIANIPLLKSGLPPLVIPTDTRREYIECLAHYQIEVGQLDKRSGVWPLSGVLDAFALFCESSYGSTKALVRNAMVEQNKRLA